MTNRLERLTPEFMALRVRLQCHITPVLPMLALSYRPCRILEFLLGDGNGCSWID
jgi:hypothetical protein